MRMAGFWAIAAAASFTFILAGCTWEQPKAPPPEEQKALASHSVTLHLPAKELVKRVVDELPQSPLQLTVVSVHDGTIVTDFKEYEGAVHIVRRWRERTRFRIVITPDFNDPTGTSHLDVFDETEEKPSDAQPWYPNPKVQRPERSDAVYAEIEKIAGKR